MGGNERHIGERHADSKKEKSPSPAEDMFYRLTCSINSNLKINVINALTQKADTAKSPNEKYVSYKDLRNLFTKNHHVSERLRTIFTELEHLGLLKHKGWKKMH